MIKNEEATVCSRSMFGTYKDCIFSMTLIFHLYLFICIFHLLLHLWGIKCSFGFCKSLNAFCLKKDKTKYEPFFFLFLDLFIFYN